VIILVDDILVVVVPLVFAFGLLEEVSHGRLAEGARWQGVCVTG
jgi:hypothetical protein